MIRYDAAQASATIPAILDLEALKPLARALSSAVGANCEVVVHDLSRPAESIVCIEGNVTGRRVGEGLTDLGTRALSGEVPDETSLHGYVVNGPDGRTLRCSSIIFRDAAQRPIAALCINIDITPYLTLERLLHELTTPAQSEPLHETFTTDPALRLQEMVWREAQTLGRPVSALPRADRVALVGALERRGAFQLHGAIQITARWLGVSRFTLLNDRKAAHAQHA